MKNDEDDINVSTIATKKARQPRKKKLQTDPDENEGPTPKKQKVQHRKQPARGGGAKKKRAARKNDSGDEEDFDSEYSEGDGDYAP